MVSSFEQDAIDGLAPMFEAYHGEEIELEPKGQSARTVTAMVVRKPIESTGGLQNRDTQIEVFIRRADYSGITLNGDVVRLKKRIEDQTDTEFTVTKLLDQSAGFWHLGVS